MSSMRSGASAFLKSDGFERLLNWALMVALVVVLGLGALLGLAVYNERTREDLSTPAGRAIADMKNQVRANPNDAALRVRLGEAFASAGDFEAALESFEAALQIDEEHVGAYLDTGLALLALEEIDKSEAAFLKVVELTEGQEFAFVDSRREQALFYLGQIALADSRYEESVGYLKGALRIKRDSSDAYLALARAYYGLGEVEEAIENVSIGLTFDPNYGEARWELGTYYMEQGKEASAAVQFRRAVDTDPEADPPAEALSDLGTAEERTKSSTEAYAEKDYTTAASEAIIAFSIDPDYTAAYVALGKAYEAQGKKVEALQAYQQALERAPDDGEIKAAIDRLGGE